MKDNVKKISVILLTYNRVNFLKNALESVINQTYPFFELIIVNNGSTDGTENLCKEYAKKDERIKIVNIKDNNGASKGRNAGIDAAACEYITFVDDDDLCEPGMLEHLYKLAEEYNADISICGSRKYFDGRLVSSIEFDEILVLDKAGGLEELLKREKYTVAPPTKLFRRSLFNNIRFISNVLVDDIHVIYKVFANADIVVAQGKPLYRFRKHDDSMTSFIYYNKLTPELLNEYISMYRERTRYLSEMVPEITGRARYSQWSYMISMCEKIKTYKCDNCIDVYKWMINEIYQNINELWNSPFITEREKNLIRKHFTENNITL
jgi:glycosyltransferase involved in cell wall biosynthesis